MFASAVKWEIVSHNPVLGAETRKPERPHSGHREDLEAILHDDCGRCEELACDPIRLLDGTMTVALWDLMVEVAHRRNGSYRTAAEALACDRFWEIARFMERMAIYPWLPYDELTRRFGVQA